MNRQLQGLGLLMMGILTAVAELELDTDVLHLAAFALGGIGLYFIFSQENRDGQGGARPGGPEERNRGDDA